MQPRPVGQLSLFRVRTLLCKSGGVCIAAMAMNPSSTVSQQKLKYREAFFVFFVLFFALPSLVFLMNTMSV